VLELSCEALYMHYLDARVQGTAGQFLDGVLRELRSARTVRLHDAFWLNRDDLRQSLGPVLKDLSALGANVEYV
jgi:hypothetical protein